MPGAPLVVLVVKKPPAKAGDVRDMGSIPASGRSPGGGHGNPLQYSCLENPVDRGAWRATVHMVAKSQIQLSNWAHTHRKCWPHMFSRFHNYYKESSHSDVSSNITTYDYFLCLLRKLLVPYGLTQIICWDVVFYEQYAKCYQPYNNPPNASPPITCWASGCNLWFKKNQVCHLCWIIFHLFLPPPSPPSCLHTTEHRNPESWTRSLEHPRKGHWQVPKVSGHQPQHTAERGPPRHPRWALWQANSGSGLHLLPAPAWACRAVCSQPHGHSCQISDLLSQRPVLPAFPTDTCPSVQRACYLFSQNWKSHWLSQTPLSLFNHCLQGFSYHMQAFIMKAILPKSSSSPLSHWSLPALVPTLPG